MTYASGRKLDTDLIEISREVTPGTFETYSLNFSDIFNGSGTCIYVDSTYGNNVTAMKYRQDFPFETLDAAQAVATTGDLIVVLPGTYSASSLGVDGVDWYFHKGAVVSDNSSQIFRDTDGGGSALNYNVLGYGVFISQYSAILLSLHPDSVINFELWEGYVRPNGRCFYAREGATININVHNKLTHLPATGAIFEALLRSDNGGAGAIGGKITVNGNGKLISEGFIAQTKQGLSHDGLIKINCRGGIETTASAYNRCVVELNGGSIEINTDCILASSSNYGLSEFRIEGNFGYLRINGRITYTGSNQYLTAIGAAGKIEFNGVVVSTGGVDVSGASSEVYINNSLTTSFVGIPSVNISNGLLIVQGRLKNADTDAASDVILISGGKVILQNAVLFASNGGNTVEAATPQNMYVYSGYANGGIDANVTQVINTVSVNGFVQ